MSGTSNIPCICVLVRNDSRLLCVLREHTGFMDDFWGLPGGHVEPNESFRQAACREVLEEVGLIVKPDDLVYKLMVHRKAARDIRVDVYFEVTAYSGESKNMEPERHAKIDWLDENNLPENFCDYMTSGLSAIKQSQTYSEFGWDTLS